MIAVGIDPSLTCTGVALIGGDEVITRRVFSPNLGASLEARRLRIRRAIEGILAPIPPRVAVSVIEVPHSRQQFGAQNERVALYWFLVDQLLARGPVVEVAPAQRAKLATGNGRATKDDVVAAIRTAFPGERVPDDNVADALSLAWAGARWAGVQAPEYAPEQAAVHARLTWPNHTQREDPS
jgi:Holliday junction resolvasome RuvABC endonuclease subunit